MLQLLIVLIFQSYSPILFNQYPGGVSTKSYIHYGQWIKTGERRMFDYGPFENRLIYNSRVPTKYPFENITTPIYIIYGTNDWLSTPEVFFSLLSNRFIKQKYSLCFVFSLFLGRSRILRRFTGKSKDLR